MVRAVCAKRFPDPKIRVIKKQDSWVVKRTFHNPNPCERINNFEIEITYSFKKINGYRIFIKALDLDGFQGKVEDLTGLTQCNYLSKYHQWKDDNGVIFLGWLVALRDGTYLRPTQDELNGGNGYKDRRRMDSAKLREELGKKPKGGYVTG